MQHISVRTMKKNVPWHILAPSAGREATNSVPPQCDPRGALFCLIGNATQFPIKQKTG